MYNSVPTNFISVPTKSYFLLTRGIVSLRSVTYMSSQIFGSSVGTCSILLYQLPILCTNWVPQLNIYMLYKVYLYRWCIWIFTPTLASSLGSQKRQFFLETLAPYRNMFTRLFLTKKSTLDGHLERSHHLTYAHNYQQNCLKYLFL